MSPKSRTQEVGREEVPGHPLLARQEAGGAMSARGENEFHELWNVGRTRDVVAKRAGDLTGHRCACGCNEGSFVCRDHPDALQCHVYDYTERALILGCSVCRTFLVKIKVAECPARPSASSAVPTPRFRSCSR